MIIDGRKIAEDIFDDLRARIEVLGRSPRLSVITCNPNFETQKYLALKKKKAHDVGIETNIIELGEEHTTEDFLARIREASATSDGVIVQLPLPAHIDTSVVLTAVPPSEDVDALNPQTVDMLSPVVGAFQEILKIHGVAVQGKFVTIVGSGRLVGIPASRWFADEGASISIVTKDTIDIKEYTKNADIVVCGAGVPGLLTPDMVKEGVIILDAGTSEDGGVLKGDADPACESKALLFTPVPGGIGPMTIAVLLRNVVNCASRK